MIFAAGRGTRMGTLTARLPKPLIEVAGTPLLDRALALAEATGVSRKVVNTHYLGEMIADHLRARGDVSISDEAAISDKALETGGGLKQALPLLGPGPVYTLNADAVWTGDNPLTQLASAWDGRRMSALLLLVPLARATGHPGKGDFARAADGRLTRLKDAPSTAGLVYTGAQITTLSGLSAIMESRFSLNMLWDDMIARNRLFGIIHTGGWADVGTPEGIVRAEALLRREGGDV